jgi:hypothetical protein
MKHDALKLGLGEYLMKRYVPRLAIFLFIVFLGQVALSIARPPITDAMTPAERHAYESVRLYGDMSMMGLYLVAFAIFLGPPMLEAYRASMAIKRQIREDGERL